MGGSSPLKIHETDVSEYSLFRHGKILVELARFSETACKDL